MLEKKLVSILFDAGHGEEVTPEESGLTQLVSLLLRNGFQLHTTHEALTGEHLNPFQVLVLGNPYKKAFSKDEINAITSYVRGGGGLLLISSATIFGNAGDHARKTNLNSIAQHFNLQFSDKAVTFHREEVEGSLDATPTDPHPVTEGIRTLHFTAATSIGFSKTGLPLFRIAHAPASPVVIAASNIGEGRVLAMGGSTPFFDNFIETFDHEIFIIQALYWLAGLTPIQPIQRIRSETVTPKYADETAQSIEDLRDQIVLLEQELTGLKKIINTTMQEMQKIIRSLQEKDESDVSTDKA